MTILLDYSQLVPNQDVKIELSTGKSLVVRSNLKTDVEINYFLNGGILPLVLRNQVKSATH